MRKKGRMVNVDDTVGDVNLSQFYHCEHIVDHIFHLATGS